MATLSAGPRRGWAAATPTGRRSCSASEGRELRDAAEACVAAALSGELAGAPWQAMLGAAEAAGDQAGRGGAGRSRAWPPRPARAGTEGPGAARARPRRQRRRAARRARTEALDLGLALIAAWLRDLAAVAEGADGLVLNCRSRSTTACGDRRAGGLDHAPRARRRASW